MLRTLVFVTLGTVIVFVLRICGAVELAKPDQTAEERSATINDNEVRLQPVEATFEIPQNWLKWHAEQFAPHAS